MKELRQKYGIHRQNLIAIYLIFLIAIFSLTRAANLCFETKFPRLYGGNLANTTFTAISMLNENEVSIHIA